MDNQIAGGSGALRGANGHPLPAQYSGPKDPGTVEQLRDVKAQVEALQKKLSDLTEDHDALKKEYDETLKDVGVVADEYAALTSAHAALKELHIMAMDRIAGMEAAPVAAAETAVEAVAETVAEEPAAAAEEKES